MSSSEQDLAEGPLTQLINLLTSQDDQPQEQEYQLPKKEFRHPGKEDQRLRQGDQCPEGEYRHLGQECEHLSLGKPTLGQENLHLWQETCQRQQVGSHLGQSEGPLWQEDMVLGQDNQQPVIGQMTLGNDIAPPKIFNAMEEEEEDDFDGVVESLPACETLLLHISSSSSSTESLDCQPLDELWTCDVEPTENPGSVPPNWQSSHFTAPCQKDGIHQPPMPEDCLYQSSSLFSDKESNETFDQSTDPQIASQDEKDQGNRQAQITSSGDINSILEIQGSVGVPRMDEDRAQPHCQEKACITGMQKWAFSSQPKEDLNHDPAEITVDTLNAHVFSWAPDLEKGTSVPQDKGKKLIREMQKRIFNNEDTDEDTEGHEATTSKTFVASNSTPQVLSSTGDYCIGIKGTLPPGQGKKCAGAIQKERSVSSNDMSGVTLEGLCLHFNSTDEPNSLPLCQFNQFRTEYASATEIGAIEHPLFVPHSAVQFGLKDCMFQPMHQAMELMIETSRCSKFPTSKNPLEIPVTHCVSQLPERKNQVTVTACEPNSRQDKRRESTGNMGRQALDRKAPLEAICSTVPTCLGLDLELVAPGQGTKSRKSTWSKGLNTETSLAAFGSPGASSVGDRTICGSDTRFMPLGQREVWTSEMRRVMEVLPKRTTIEAIGSAEASAASSSQDLESLTPEICRVNMIEEREALKSRNILNAVCSLRDNISQVFASNVSDQSKESRKEIVKVTMSRTSVETMNTPDALTTSSSNDTVSLLFRHTNPIDVSEKPRMICLEDFCATGASSVDSAILNSFDRNSLTPGQREVGMAEMSSGREASSRWTSLDVTGLTGSSCIVKGPSIVRSLTPGQCEEWRVEMHDWGDDLSSKPTLETLGLLGASLVKTAPTSFHVSKSLRPRQPETSRFQISDGRETLTKKSFLEVLGSTEASYVDATMCSYSLTPSQHEFRRAVISGFRVPLIRKISLEVIGSTGSSSVDKGQYNFNDSSTLNPGQRKVWRSEISEKRLDLKSTPFLETMPFTCTSSVEKGPSITFNLKSPTLSQREAWMSEMSDMRGALTRRTSLDVIGSTGDLCVSKDRSIPSDLNSLVLGWLEVWKTELMSDDTESSTRRPYLEVISSTGSPCVGKGPCILSDLESVTPGQCEVWNDENNDGRQALTRRTPLASIGTTGVSIYDIFSSFHNLNSLTPDHEEVCRPEMSERRWPRTSRTFREPIITTEAPCFDKGPKLPHELKSLTPCQCQVLRTEISDAKETFVRRASMENNGLCCSGSAFTGVHLDFKPSSHPAKKPEKRHAEPSGQIEDYREVNESQPPKRTRSDLPSYQGEEVQAKGHLTVTHRTGQGGILHPSGNQSWMEAQVQPFDSGHQMPRLSEPLRIAAQNLELLLLKHHKGNAQVHSDMTPFRYTYPEPSKTQQNTAQGIRCPPTLTQWAIQYIKYLNTSEKETRDSHGKSKEEPGLSTGVCLM